MTNLVDTSFNNFLTFVHETQPKSICLNNPELREVYNLVNDIYTACSILIDHGYVDIEDNYYELLVEYKDYYGRFLLAMTLNDEYLVNSLFRLLTEKLYRIIFGFHNPFKSKSSIKRHSRIEMSSRLTVPLLKKQELDNFYGKYSNLIHHSIANGSENLDLRNVYTTDRNLMGTMKQELSELNIIFLLDYFKPFCISKDLKDLSFVIAVSNRLSESTKVIIQDIIQN